MDGVSWWQSVPELSLDLVDPTGIDVSDPVIDVGAGWSTLVDHLCERAYRDLTAIDLSEPEFETVRERLAPANDHVALEVADVLDLDEGRRSRLWHDCAVFHSPTEHDERDNYRASLARRLQPAATSSWRPLARTAWRHAAGCRSCATPTRHSRPSSRTAPWARPAASST